MVTTRRESLKLLLVPFSLALAGCNNRHRKRPGTTEPYTGTVVDRPVNPIEPAAPVVEERKDYTGEFVSISSDQDYLTGRVLNSSFSELAFSYKDGRGNWMTPSYVRNNEGTQDELSPQIAGDRWIVPVTNLESRSQGPYELAGVWAKVNNEWVYEKVGLKIPSLPVARSDFLPPSTASPRQRENALRLAGFSRLSVRSRKPVVVLGNDGGRHEFNPVVVESVSRYDGEEHCNNQVIARLSEIFIHGSQVYSVASPLNHLNDIIVDEIYGGGTSWSDRVRIGISPWLEEGSSCCSTEKVCPREVDEKEYGYLQRAFVDVHELAHILHKKGAFPFAEEFELISFDKNGQIRPDATHNDFVRAYSETNKLEDLADVAGQSVAFGEDMRILASGSEKLGQKYGLFTGGALGGRSWRKADMLALGEMTR
ncbi:MAG TPA: hypothetical protein VJB06_04745 [archaeon]|nr:hypothetical protein [archaeon]